MVILSGWVGFLRTLQYKGESTELIDGGDMSSCWNDTVWGEDRTDGQKYGPSIILLVVRTALLAMMMTSSIS